MLRSGWRSRSSPGDKPSFSKTRIAELKKYIKGAEKKHQAFRIQVQNVADGKEFNVMAESAEVSIYKVAPPSRQHAWTGRCKVLSDLNEEQLYGSSTITTGNGSACRNVSMSLESLLSNGFLSPTGQ